MLTLDQFIAKYNGQKVDFDHHYGDQCMDLYRLYVQEVWGKEQTPAVKSAKDVFATIDPNLYDKFTSGKFLPGDVIVWSDKYSAPDGHIDICKDPNDPKKLIAFGQNNPKNAPCQLATHNYSNIVGWFRPKQALAKTFMAVSVVANKNKWVDLPGRLENVKQRMLADSDGRFEPVFDIVKTEFDNIPYSPPVPGMPKCVDVNWYRQNITPLTKGQATIFLINPEDYYTTIQYGFMSWGDPGRPIRIEVIEPESESHFEDVVEHELGGHGCQFLTGQPDITHALLNQNPPKFKELMNYLDYLKLQQALVKIKG